MFIPLLVIVFGIVWLLSRWRTRSRNPGEPPLVSGWLPYFGVSREFATKRLAFLQECKRHHGNVFTCLLSGQYITFITDPFAYGPASRLGPFLDFHEFAGKLLRKAFAIIDYSDPKYNISEHELHRLNARALQGEALADLTKSVRKTLQSIIQQEIEERQRFSNDGWHEEGLYSFCSRIMLHAGFVTLFGHNKSLSSTTMKNVRDDFQRFDDAFAMVMAGIPMWLLRGAFKARVALEQRFLAENVETLLEPSTLIAQRIAMFNRSNTLSDLQKARAHFAVLWAAHANTLPLAFWVLFYFLRNPEALKAVRAEVEELCGADLNLSENRIPLDQRQLNGLVNLSSAVKETMRLVSSAMHVRVAKQNFNLDLGSGRTYSIRRGDMLAMVPELTYMDPEIYAKPEEFHHDRYIDEFGKERTSFQYRGRDLKHFLMPFGSGSSMCPGRFFALNEIRQLMVLLLCHFDMELVHPEDPPPKSRRNIGIQPPREDVMFRYRCKV
uniref:Uncharacterized protein n=1 Tax=Eptatretus burgeri TaxID=7764 RepID=A0A8C4QPW9_EPTBU